MATDAARELIDQHLEALAEELTDAPARGGIAARRVAEASGLCALLGRPELAARLAAALADVTVEDWFRNAITNIDLATVDVARLRRPRSADEVDRDNPLCPDDALFNHLRERAARDAASEESRHHLELSLRGDVDGAVRAAREELDLAEVAAVLVVLGQAERALAFIDAKPVPEYRRSAVEFLVLTETCRRRLPGFEAAVRAAELSAQTRMPLILALAGRRPWAGYPFPDW